jgi:two-component system KDP operon response regulator KdpE
MTLKVLVVEDDAGIRGLLRASLAAEGFAVTTAVSLSEALALLQHDPPGLIVLDLGLPDGDGAELVRAVRQRSSLPIVVASARAEPAGKIALLDAGADDYLVKPFSVAELLARIRVALRHRGSVLQPALRHFSGDGLSIDLDTRRVERDGEAVHLTPTEFELLARLLRSGGRIVTHRQLLVDVWGAEHAADTHYLRLYMGQLRAKLERSPPEPRFLLTEIGVGYRFAVD